MMEKLFIKLFSQFSCEVKHFLQYNKVLNYTE